MPSCADKECDGRKQVMQLDTSALVTGDIKMVMIQEPVEESRHGTPAIFDCILKDQYALDTFIGQRVRLIGCFRSYPQKDKSTNQILISGISTLPLDDVKELQPTEEQIKKFHELKKLPNYIAVVSESIAPEILHEGLPKLCVLLSLVGSPEVDRNVGMIHTLLIGNPATGKSRILEYIPLLIRKSALAVGGTASGTGITISMDTLANRQRMPRAGIVPLCSGGVAAIDEANQLADEDYGKLYQSMGSGWINYNKGGFDLTLKAMTTIVAGANPKYYTYNTNHSMLDNINMPEPLLSRFSLKVNMSKKKTSIERQQVLQHIDLVDRIGITEYINIKGLLQPEELSTFITYCKTFNPISTPDADKLAMDFQLQMESIEQDEGTAPIDNRFYLSVKKIAKAIARIHFSNTVTIEFVQNAIEIIKKTLITFDMNVEKGVLQLKPNQTEGWEDSMMAVVHHLQKKNSDGRFLPNELCNACVDLYPEIFKFYGSAEKKFNKIAHKFDIINGRYSINK